jgi:hypothetical protein
MIKKILIEILIFSVVIGCQGCIFPDYFERELSKELLLERERFFSKKKVSCECLEISNHKIQIDIDGNLLYFIRIKHGFIDNIALTEEHAGRFYKIAQQMLPENTSPLLPLIYKSVSKNKIPANISSFWIQAKPVPSKLYKKIIKDGDSNSISYNDAIKFISRLNIYCKGKAAFDLPLEEQFVYLAKSMYNPVRDGKLLPCKKVKEINFAGGMIKQLLGHKWQLTKSKFYKFDSDYKTDQALISDGNMYVKKGGSMQSVDALECMPEYRAESSPDTRESNTTIRLVLKLPQ